MKRTLSKTREEARRLYLTGEMTTNAEIAARLGVKAHTIGRWRRDEDWDGLRLKIDDVNQGSGRGDLRYDIPINGPNAITLPPNCNYGNPLCNTYFVLYSQWGNVPDAAYDAEGGFGARHH